VKQYWECCNRTDDLKMNDDMAKFFKNHAVKMPLDPRESFFGGRTNAVKLHHKCAADEKIHYVDICSLYPWVCKNGIFPTGIPKIFTNNFKPINKFNQPYFGLIKCKILPPRQLYLPVLPARIREKLIFTLCAKCAKNGAEPPCEHSDDERALDGTWWSMEIYKALELGYEIVEVYEVYHYENKSSDLFKGYINKFLKLKTQSSGWPADVKTDEAKQKFLEEYKKKENVDLEEGKMVKNSAQRSLAKLCLNSFWGKFGQRDNLPKTEYFTEPEKFFQTVFNNGNIIKDVQVVSENMILVTYVKEEEEAEPFSNVNSVLASAVTTQARLKLYSYMEKLQHRTLYFDTDSIIYLSGPNDTYEVPIGNFLGEMTNELEEYGSNAYISEFVSAGPKNYGYEVTVPNEDPNQPPKIHIFFLFVFF